MAVWNSPSRGRSLHSSRRLRLEPTKWGGTRNRSGVLSHLQYYKPADHLWRKRKAERLLLCNSSENMSYSGEPVLLLTALVEITEDESSWMKMVTKCVCVCVRETANYDFSGEVCEHYSLWVWSVFGKVMTDPPPLPLSPPERRWSRGGASRDTNLLHRLNTANRLPGSAWCNTSYSR